MAKDKKGSDLSTDEIIDSLAEDVGVDEAEATIRDEGLREFDDVKPHGHIADMMAAQIRSKWPVDDDHQSATEILAGEEDIRDVDLSGDEFRSQGTAVNLFLVFLLIASLGGGAYGIRIYGSAEALEAKRMEKEEQEKKFNDEQLAKQKKYGLLRIESTPPQAVVAKNGEKIVVKNEETGEELVAMTPMNMMNLDIKETFMIRLEVGGHEPYEFGVAEHLWTKNSETGEYKMFKAVELVPINCEYWFLYDAQKKKEVKFEDRGTCSGYHDDAMANQAIVTTCACKPSEVAADGEEVEEKE